MPYIAPTPAQLKGRFPVFANVDDAVVQEALDEAALRVDTTWPEKAYQPAYMLFAAHVLTLDGHGTGQEAQFAGLNASGVKSIKIASLGLTIGKDTSGAKSNYTSLLKTTSYGLRFYDMVRLNFPGVTVLNGFGASRLP